MDDQLDVPLEDSELLAEVELTTNLIIAASEAADTLPQSVVDRILGLEPRPRRESGHDQRPGYIPAQSVRHSA